MTELSFLEGLMKKTLIIGYGNLDRQDDGVAWHVLAAIAGHYGYTDFEDEQEHLTENQYPHLLFDLQLMPEMAETIRDYERVLFVDATPAPSNRKSPGRPSLQSISRRHSRTI